MHIFYEEVEKIDTLQIPLQSLEVKLERILQSRNRVFPLPWNDLLCLVRNIQPNCLYLGNINNFLNCDNF